MKTVKTGTVRSKINAAIRSSLLRAKSTTGTTAGNRQPYRGKVMAVDVRNAKVKVEGAMIVKRHRKPVPQLNREGGIIEQEAWVSISNVALIDPETGKPTRVKIEERDGKKVRVAKSGKIVADSGSYKRESIKKLEGDEAE
ncbi:MAG: 50S ribosomal protein L24 [Chloracidobacterium sp.]|nr:50S ribosomal protein L24 [Chloracidobacterium sp.]